ncbi:MAG: DUF1700 domain-containing protein [Oscillospiraceae bacterium]|nr:DUF1700 domain-containing protein [Oscillospiraceae bacterium]
MNRESYVKALSEELDRLGVAAAEKEEILGDFGGHFEEGAQEGLTEEQICTKLGDIGEIAQQYAGEQSGKTFMGTDENGVSMSTMRWESIPPVENAQGFSVGGLIGIICADVFVFSWAIPIFVSLVASYYAIVISFLFYGVLMALPLTMLSVFETNMNPISAFSLGVMFLSLGGLGGILGLKVGRGFVWVMKWFINLHSLWTVGRNVFKKNKAKEAVS